MKNKLTALFFVLSVLSIQSCKKENESEENEGNEVKISSFNSTESHNMGQNCMSCHTSGGNGEGWFNIAGTVYDSTGTTVKANTTIKLYTGPNSTGALKYTIKGDAKGNFYTTESINFGSGLYPSIQGSTTTKHMSGKIGSGSCNNCHGGGVTTKLWTK